MVSLASDPAGGGGTDEEHPDIHAMVRQYQALVQVRGVTASHPAAMELQKAIAEARAKRDAGKSPKDRAKNAERELNRKRRVAEGLEGEIRDLDAEINPVGEARRASP